MQKERRKKTRFQRERIDVEKASSLFFDQKRMAHCKCWELETEKKSSNELLVYILKIIKIVQWMICPFRLRDC